MTEPGALSAPLADVLVLSAQVWASVAAGQSLDRSLATRVPSGPSQLRAAVQDVSYGALRRRALCERVIAELAARPPAADVRALLAVALSQLLAGRHAPHTVVDQAVAAARSHHATAGAAGFINAVLRNFLRQQAALVDRLLQLDEVRYNAPGWWSDAMRAAHPEQWRAVLESQQRAPALVDEIVPVALEGELLAPLAEFAHVIDTSGLHPNLLRYWVREFVDSPEARLTLSFESFAFKDGVPVAPDLVFDVRNLPNPHFDRELRPLTGRDGAVIRFLETAPAAAEMIDDIAAFIGKWLPSYVADNRHYLTVAIGCTGGRHRSVCVVEELARRLSAHETVLVRHRALEPSDP